MQYGASVSGRYITHLHSQFTVSNTSAPCDSNIKRAGAIVLFAELDGATGPCQYLVHDMPHAKRPRRPRTSCFVPGEFLGLCENGKVLQMRGGVVRKTRRHQKVNALTRTLEVVRQSNGTVPLLTPQLKWTDSNSNWSLRAPSSITWPLVRILAPRSPLVHIPDWVVASAPTGPGAQGTSGALLEKLNRHNTTKKLH